jgi:hypothetical protein
MNPAASNALPFSGSLPDFDFEAVLVNATDKTCDYFRDAFLAAHRTAKVENQIVENQVYDSLQLLCSFMPNYGDRAEPYRPMAIIDGRRSLLPSDLTPADLDFVAALYGRAKVPALRARLGDVLFLRRRDHKAGLDAAVNYVAAGKRLVTKASWIYAGENFKRALQLSGMQGRDNAVYKEAAAAVMTALTDPLADTEGFFACKLLKVAIQTGLNDPSALAQIAHTHAEKGLLEKEFRRSREYRMLEGDFLILAKQEADAWKVRELIGDTYVEEAEQALQRTPPSYSAASHLLVRGIQAMRQAKCDPARITALRERLRHYQLKSMDEFQTFGYDVDLSDLAAKAMEFVRGLPLEDAIVRLALQHNVINVKKLREEVLEMGRQAPLSVMMGADIVNRSGQVQKTIGGISPSSTEDQEPQIEERMFQAAARTNWPFRAQGYIQPARMQIWQEHPITPENLTFLVINNPFIPPGHETIFLRGLFYGFAGDMMLATHLLVPQIENSIRHLLESNDVEVSNLMSNNTQPAKLLGPLMDLPETKALFGEDLVFEIRGLLMEKTGYSFRHNVAHGFVGDHDCYSPAAVNSWWLVLRLCLMSFGLLDESSLAAEGGM